MDAEALKHPEYTALVTCDGWSKLEEAIADMLDEFSDVPDCRRLLAYLLRDEADEVESNATGTYGPEGIQVYHPTPQEAEAIWAEARRQVLFEDE